MNDEELQIVYLYIIRISTVSYLLSLWDLQRSTPVSEIEETCQEPPFRPTPAQEDGGSVPEGMTNDTAKQIALLHGRVVSGDFGITIVTEGYCLIQLSSV